MVLATTIASSACVRARTVSSGSSPSNSPPLTEMARTASCARKLPSRIVSHLHQSPRGRTKFFFGVDMCTRGHGVDLLSVSATLAWARSQAFQATGLLVRHLALDRASLFDSSWLIEHRIQAKVSVQVPPPHICFYSFPPVCVS